MNAIHAPARRVDHRDMKVRPWRRRGLEGDGHERMFDHSGSKVKGNLEKHLTGGSDCGQRGSVAGPASWLPERGSRFTRLD